MNPLDVVLVIAAIAWILGRRLAGQLLEVKRLLVMPGVLIVIGLSELGGAWSPTAVAFAAVGIVLSVGLGLVRGTTVHLGRRNGELWMRYRVASIGLWVVNLAAKCALFPIERAVSAPAASAADRSILLSIGVGVLAETAIVLLRAMRTDGEIVWTAGRDGAPHATNPTFEKVRETVNLATDPNRPVAADGRRWPRPTHDW